MRTLRLRITRLKNKIGETLSDDNNLLGYAGINKENILKSLSESYDLLAPLEEFDTELETIIAKREVASCLEDINWFIDEGYHSDNAINEFNNCLNSVAKIRFVLRETLISLTEKPLRIDSELAKAKSSLESLTADLESLEDIKSKINQIESDSQNFITELQNKHTTSIENEEKINTLLAEIAKIHSTLSGTNEKIGIWRSEIQSIIENISSKQVEASQLTTEIEQLKDAVKKSQEELNSQGEELKKQISENSTHQQEIQKTIEDVSRAGMAGSFKKRKDELQKTQITWAVSTIITLLILIGISFYIVLPILNNEAVKLEPLLYKIPLFASCVWLAWFCSKQYGYTSRIREDYAFKYAISLAFEGYKKETKEVNATLLERLIEFTIQNISRNPVSNYNTKHNHGSPINEMIDNVSSKVLDSKDKQ